MRVAIPIALFLSLLLVGPAADAQETRGRETYVAECAGCHGPEGRGTVWAPSIADEGAAGADLMMRSGRMPLLSPDEPIERRPARLSGEQIDAISEYVATFGGPPIPTVDPGGGDLGTGAELYLLNCAACHGSTGVGAALVASRDAPSLLQSSSLGVAEAVRSGPGAMPSFGDDLIDGHELNSLVRYVEELKEGRSPGGWDLGRWGPVAEGAAAWLFGVVAVLAAAVWIEASSEGPVAESEEESR